ncbi:MAG: hypothetical protein ACXU86_25195 [Archangium sp.]
MPPHEPGQVISLQTERLRRRPPAPLAKSPHVLVASPRRDKDQRRLRRRKVKLAVVGACLVGVLASLLSIALDSTDEEPGTMSERSERVDDSDRSESDDSPDEVSPFQPSSAEGHDVAGSAWFSAQGGGQR